MGFAGHRALGFVGFVGLVLVEQVLTWTKWKRFGDLCKLVLGRARFYMQRHTPSQQPKPSLASCPSAAGPRHLEPSPDTLDELDCQELERVGLAWETLATTIQQHSGLIRRPETSTDNFPIYVQGICSQGPVANSITSRCGSE